MTDALDPKLIEPNYPLQTHLGMRMTAWRQDYARIEIPIADTLMNRQGLPHGGIHATLLDSAMGYAGCYTGDPDRKQMALTLSLTVNYLAQAAGEVLIAEGWRTGGGRKTYFAEGRVTDHTGTVIATATGVFRYRNSG
ncbi:PaaI family thioesterase [Pseudohalocynthiibacter aestuariivivens]|uniref:PaaI family thioesterase n=1 Tax=Roseovarius pelagicus TaxID=2980108 RepID=A0ABY6D761_9RHOB|nr:MULTISPECIES: PaaI family thioesterase [Rhodobacterales]QIE46069.1 PaaI family thioesterase [Pseudohalocynthiibacter aestuariivivens]UXX81970.1 PaaI family thioesterase [Roseovarius pelagicus]